MLGCSFVTCMCQWPVLEFLLWKFEMVGLYAVGQCSKPLKQFYVCPILGRTWQRRRQQHRRARSEHMTTWSRFSAGSQTMVMQVFCCCCHCFIASLEPGHWQVRCYMCICPDCGWKLDNTLGSVFGGLRPWKLFWGSHLCNKNAFRKMEHQNEAKCS